MFSILIIGFSTIALGLNIFLNYTSNPWFNAIFLIIIIVFCIISFISSTKRQNIQRKQEFIIKEVLHSLGETSNTNIQDVRAKIDTLKQKNTKYKNDKHYLHSKIKMFSTDFKVMVKLLNYFKEQEDETLNEIIQTLKNGINKNNEDAKNILNEVNSYTVYDEQNDKKVFYDECFAAIILKSPLQELLLKLYLLEFGIKSSVFHDNNINYDNFDLVFIDEDLAICDKPNMVFFGTNNQQNRLYINDILNKNELKHILSKLLHNKQTTKNINSAFGVLIFRKNDFDNRFMLGMSNTCISGNNYVNNITDFKKELKNQYKIIVVDYEAIKFDFESIKSSIFSLKSKNPYIKIILIPGNDYKSFDFDFADITLKEDISQSDFIKMIKDNS